MGIELKISQSLADAAGNNWNDSCNSWRWIEDNLEDLKNEISGILSALPDSDAMLEIMGKAFVIESCVMGAYSSDESGYSCAAMDINPELFKRGVRDMMDDYLDAGCDAENCADNEEIMGMSLEDDSLSFPDGQEFVVKKRDAYDFLNKIGIDPDDVIDMALEMRNGETDGPKDVQIHP